MPEVFFKEIGEQLGFRIHIITARGEAHYTFRGVIEDGDDTVGIADIGGASTELIKVSRGSLEKTISLPVGSVRGSDWEREGRFEENLENIFANERFETKSFQTDRLLGVGGTMTVLAAISMNMKDFDSEKIENCSFSQRDLQNCIGRIEKQSEEQLRREFPFLGKRSRSIKAGGRLATMMGKILGVQTWEISAKGIRHGTLLEGRIREDFTI